MNSQLISASLLGLGTSIEDRLATRRHPDVEGKLQRTPDSELHLELNRLLRDSVAGTKSCLEESPPSEAGRNDGCLRQSTPEELCSGRLISPLETLTQLPLSLDRLQSQTRDGCSDVHEVPAQRNLVATLFVVL